MTTPEIQFVLLATLLGCLVAYMIWVRVRGDLLKQELLIQALTLDRAAASLGGTNDQAYRVVRNFIVWAADRADLMTIPTFVYLALNPFPAPPSEGVPLTASTPGLQEPIDAALNTALETIFRHVLYATLTGRAVWLFLSLFRIYASGNNLVTQQLILLARTQRADRLAGVH